METGGSQEQKSIKVIEKNVDPKTKEDFFEPNVKSVLTMSSQKEVQNTVLTKWPKTHVHVVFTENVSLKEELLQRII